MNLEAVRKVIDDLNDRGFEYVGHAFWSVSYCGSGSIVVEAMGIPIWDSEEDEREQIGTCPKCGGSGADPDWVEGSARPTCPTCGGDGEDDLWEPLAAFLPRRLMEIALELLLMAGPKSDSETSMAHDDRPVPDPPLCQGCAHQQNNCCVRSKTLGVLSGACPDFEQQ